MPPKKPAPSQPGKKTEMKKKEKIIEDKTFGLKNKKGAKNQKFIQQVSTQVKHGNVSLQKLEQMKREEKEKKDKIKTELDGLNQLLKPVAENKISKDADPKSVLCAFFKLGQCKKGDKCKFSHDLTIERKSEKRSMYVDKRDLGEDTMDNWDDARLNEVVEQKHGAKEKQKNTTEIICKYFLDALEASKYGWFWECPNGESCIYRHALPPGYVLKKDKKKMEENQGPIITLEELVEKERAALTGDLTKVTLQSFLAWKKRKIHEKREATAKEEKTKRRNFKQGKQAGLSGRDLFTFNPNMGAEDEDDEEGGVAYASERNADDGDEEEGIVREIDERMFYEFDETGELLTSAAETSNSKVEINEDLFDEDELDDIDEDDGDSSAADDGVDDDSTPGPSGLTNGFSRLKTTDNVASSAAASGDNL